MMSTGIPNTNEVQPEQKVLLTGSAFFVSGQDAWDVSLLKDRTLDTPLQKRTGQRGSEQAVCDVGTTSRLDASTIFLTTLS